MKELRPYQKDLRQKTIDSLLKINKLMLQLPTGGGKTITFVDLAKYYIEQGKLVWILVHRNELTTQTSSKLTDFDILHSVIQAGYHYSRFASCQIVSVQTVVRRLSKVRPPDLIICDEAHHSTANTYRKIYEYYPKAKIIGVTATPCRTNGEGFKDLFDKLICGPSVKELISMGFLCEPKIFAKPLSFNLSELRQTAGDYNDKDLSLAMDKQEIIGDLVNTYLDKAKGKKAIVFAVNINHSKHIVEMFNNCGIKAEHLDGTTDKVERNTILRRFRKGETLILSNVNIVTEGFDVPDCEVVILAKPTTSLSMFLQMVGRGLRTFNGKKYALILDHADCVFQHGFPQQDRDWTLKGKKRNKKDGIFKDNIRIKDKKTGELFKRSDLPPNVTDIELVELDIDDLRMQQMDNLLNKFVNNGFRPGVAWSEFVKKVKKPTLSDITNFRIKAGYNPKWEYYKKVEFGYLEERKN